MHFRIFKAGAKLDIFYNLLVKEEENAPNAVVIDIEDRKDVIEVSHRFRSSRNFYNAYVTRTLIELLLGAATLAWLCFSGLPAISTVRVLNYFRNTI